MKRNKNCTFTIEQEKQICADYDSGLSCVKLAKKWGSNTSSIHKILKIYKVKMRTLSEARNNFIGRKLNTSIFSVIDSREKAYWLGTFYADGYISKTNPYTNYFGMTIKSSDIEWLNKLQKFLDTNISIRTYMQSHGYKIGEKYSRLLIGNNEIVSDLEKWGVVEHKTKKICALPKIQFLDDFIRGYIDGDGSLRSAYPNFRICGNKEFLEDIALYFGIPYHIIPDKTIYSLAYNVKESEYLEKRLYKNAPVYLKRKFEIAKRSFNSPLTLEDVRKNSE